jgi:hypothetical protein
MAQNPANSELAAPGENNWIFVHLDKASMLSRSLTFTIHHALQSLIGRWARWSGCQCQCKVAIFTSKVSTKNKTIATHFIANTALKNALKRSGTPRGQFRARFSKKFATLLLVGPLHAGFAASTNCSSVMFAVSVDEGKSDSRMVRWDSESVPSPSSTSAAMGGGAPGGGRRCAATGAAGPPGGGGGNV